MESELFFISLTTGIKIFNQSRNFVQSDWRRCLDTSNGAVNCIPATESCPDASEGGTFATIQECVTYSPVSFYQLTFKILLPFSNLDLRPLYGPVAELAANQFH